MAGDPVLYDVLVLGGGLSGLGAMLELKRSGRHVCLLEAQSVPGGRVRTVKMRLVSGGVDCGHSVEGGAQWIHGKDNSLYKIAEDNNLISPELGDEACGRFIREDGKVFDEYLVKQIDFIVGQILEQCEQFVECPLQPDLSIRQYLEDKFEVFLNENNDIDPAEARQLLDWHIRFQIIDNSCWDLRDVGVNAWGRYSFNGESCQAHINVKSGFNQVVDAIVKEIGSENIQCGHEVVQVKWGEEMATVVCRNGKVFKSKYLIVTFPIGILKGSQMFLPPLPQDVNDEINAMGYGTIDKIFLQFNEPFWDEDFKGIQFLWTKATETIPSDWVRWMTGFDLIDGNILVGWIGGPGAIEMEKLTDSQIMTRCMEVLTQFTKTVIPKPSEFYCTRWASNEFEKGSYCFNGLHHGPPPRVSLQDPVKYPHSTNPLFLAGEACHPSYFSTAHGAFESGISQAKKVLLLLK